MHTLQNEYLRLSLDANGDLHELINLHSGHNYAGGHPLWRLIYSRGEVLEIESEVGDGQPNIEVRQDEISICFERVQGEDGPLNFRLDITLQLCADEVHFRYSLANDEPDTLLRECHFPRVRGMQLPEGQELIWSFMGGQKLTDLRSRLQGQGSGYMAEDQAGLQLWTTYPGSSAATNCFVFADEKEGLYFGSHDNSFQRTLHLMRLIQDDLEAGFVKYPLLATGQSVSNEHFVISPYSGTWHHAARKYQLWAQTWFRRAEFPAWVARMNGWQRLISKHQYGKNFFPYNQLFKAYSDGKPAGIAHLLLFGWHAGGHDNMYPDYVCDPAQGGSEALREQVQEIQADGGRVSLYFNGRLIDLNSDFYDKYGQRLCIKDLYGNSGKENYAFGGIGTGTRVLAQRAFTSACPATEAWYQVLRGFANTAIDLGCDAVFYDQMGGEETVCTDVTHGHEVPLKASGLAKAEELRLLREHINSRKPDMGLGIEIISDVTAQHVDYIHSLWGARADNDWQTTGEKPKMSVFFEWFRYIFPSVILSDREIRDDTDIERRVNYCLLHGLRSDVEIYRCRATIAEAPNYRAYLTQANRLRQKYFEFLLDGTYRDTDGFTVDNDEIDARCFTSGNRLAVVMAQSHREEESATLRVPDYRLVEHDGLGLLTVEARDDAARVTLPRHALAVSIWEKVDS